jgi:hypothetical protein
MQVVVLRQWWLGQSDQAIVGSPEFSLKATGVCRRITQVLGEIGAQVVAIIVR